MTITLVTTTRNRAFCFGLLERWMDRQSVKWDQWLVINDGAEEYSYTMGQEVVLRDPSSDTMPSICENWLAGLPLVRGDVVLCIEDDDWYHPDYIATMAGLLEGVDLAGVSHDVYWKFVSRKFLRMHNATHASLACTGFRSKLVPEVAFICRAFKDIFIDMILWQHIHTIGGTWKLIPQPLASGQMYHVGMKNMPGATGLGMGHTNPDQGSSDPTFANLEKWVGPEAARTYRKVWRDYCG